MKTYFFITCQTGLQSIVKNEIKQMNRKILQVEDGFVIAEGAQQDIARFNIGLRSASRVYILLAQKKITNFDELYDTARQLEIEKYMNDKDVFNVEVRSYRSTLSSTSASTKIVKKAFADRLMSAYNVKNLPETGRSFEYSVRLIKNQAYFLLETSGEALHKRGYRLEGYKAPLRENMAAALLLMMRYYGKGAFLDPLCGSGTIAIEAAMISRNIAPGMNRDFAFEKLGLLPRRDLLQVKKEFEKNVKEETEFSISCSDQDKEAVEICHENVKRAGLEKDIQIKQIQMEDLKITDKRMVVVTNMPYAKRLFSEQRLRELEEGFNQTILTHHDFTVGILSSNYYYPFPDDRRANKVRKLMNGPLEAYFYEFFAKRGRS